MLDAQTKKRIDDCRDILVGKITDPKSQVEQITIALVYKFMDDMDKQSEEWGGKRDFFTGDYLKYSWDNILSPRIDAHEMLNLYSEGIEKMNENPNLKPLLRNMLADAYLPYRDPETLKLFLKTIDGFSYENSERLGDAYEYLLSVLGSQGDAGQFRTPRHIIDFIVEIIQPKKDDKILDPACGTAGFLISAYKHILKKNTDKRFGDKLSSSEKVTLLNNIYGYDISPDMIRLSLVNLFLHGFTEDDLNIREYDSLTSEDRWNEYFDIVLANPPFMTPKGGIRPHNRFSIKSNRAEVLFVNYIMEHLTPKGKAGIVVPEGIIFQSGTAYKQLRKSLIEKYLIGVVSLPSGVFNPYSGVKTSILILDRQLSQKTDKIFFGKVENDGYSLGAQRSEIDENDLPKIKDGILEYCENLSDGIDKEHPNLSYVPKEEILNSSDIGLSFERYFIEEVISSNFEVVELSSVVEISRGGSPRPIKDYITNDEDGVNWIKIGDTSKKSKYITSTKEKIKSSGISKSRKVEIGDFILSNSMSFGKPYISKIEGYIHDGWLLLKLNEEKISSLFLYYILSSKKVYNQFKQKATGGVVNNLNKQLVSSVQIPLPTLEIQKEIVEELEQYQKVIEGAKLVVDNYKPHIDIDESWDSIRLKDLIKISSGKGLVKRNMIDGEYNVYGGNGISGKHNSYFVENKTIVIGRVGEYCGAVHLTTPKAWITDNGLYITKLYKDVELDFLSLSLTLLNLNKYAKVGGQPSISQSTILELEIKLPPIKIQHQIVKKLEEEKQIVEGNKKLIEIYTQKIEDRINKIWGK